jgi:hypothetical protein
VGGKGDGDLYDVPSSCCASAHNRPLMILHARTSSCEYGPILRPRWRDGYLSTLSAMMMMMMMLTEWYHGTMRGLSRFFFDFFLSTSCCARTAAIITELGEEEASSAGGGEAGGDTDVGRYRIILNISRSGLCAK